MIQISEFILNFLINAAWQIAVVALVALICSRLLSNAPARYRHGLWVATLLLSIALPLWSLFGFAPYTPNQISKPPISVARTSEDSARHASSAPPRITVSVTDSGRQVSHWFRNRRQSFMTDANLLVALAFAYAFFILYRVTRLWISWRQTRCLLRSVDRREISPRITAVATKCQAAFQLRTVPVVCSELAPAPVTVGALKPLVILPETFYRELGQERGDATLYSVLGHEMAHIARRDFALNLVYEFLLLPISFHPLTRFIKRQIDRTRELACDEMVSNCLLAPETHARSLLRVARSLVIPADRSFMLGVFDADILEERIMKLTRNTRRLGRHAGRLLALSCLSFLCFAGLTISTFSFELRTRRVSAAALNTSDGIAVAQQPANEVRAGKTEDSHREANRTVSSQVETERTLTSPSAQHRAQAACDAGRRHAVEAIPLLVSMLGDDAPIDALKCWGNGKWTPALDTFKQPSPGEQAAIALASMGTPAFEPLTNALASTNASVRRNAAWAIGELTNMAPGERADSVVPLISLFSDSDSWVRMAAARALGELRDERSAERLVAALFDGEAMVRQIAAWALGEMKEEQAVQTLCSVLVSDIRSEVRLAAAEALGEIRSQRAIQSLHQALNDSEPRVRAKVKWAIAEIEE